MVVAANLPIRLQMSDTDMLRLAAELARDLYSIGDVLSAHRLEPLFFKNHILPNPRFQQFYREAKALWASSANSPERATVKSSVLYEEWLQEADRLMHDPREPLSGKVKLMELMARVAKLDAGKDLKPTAPGERVQITINLGAAAKAPVIIDGIAAPVPAQVTHG